MSTNPKLEAREKVYAGLVGLGVPVSMYPAGNSGGSRVSLVGSTLYPTGKVDIVVKVQVPEPSGLAPLEQLEWDTLTAVRAMGGVGWSETQTQVRDEAGQIIFTEFTITTK